MDSALCSFDPAYELYLFICEQAGSNEDGVLAEYLLLIQSYFSFSTLFSLALLFSQSFAVLVPAFILRGLKEFGEPTRKALIMDLAPEERKAAVFGLYYMLRDIVVSIAAFGGAFLWMISPTVNFLTAFVFGVIGTIGYAIYGRDVKRTTC